MKMKLTVTLIVVGLVILGTALGVITPQSYAEGWDIHSDILLSILAF
jgi:hypothetical protein